MAELEKSMQHSEQQFTERERLNKTQQVLSRLPQWSMGGCRLFPPYIPTFCIRRANNCLPVSCFVFFVVLDANGAPTLPSQIEPHFAYLIVTKKLRN